MVNPQASAGGCRDAFSDLMTYKVRRGLGCHRTGSQGTKAWRTYTVPGCDGHRDPRPEYRVQPEGVLVKFSVEIAAAWAGGRAWFLS